MTSDHLCLREGEGGGGPEEGKWKRERVRGKETERQMHTDFLPQRGRGRRGGPEEKERESG